MKITASKNLTSKRAAAQAAVDADAMTARAKHATPGMELVYVLKLNEARAFLAGKGTPIDYPLLSAALSIDGSSLTEVADAIVAADLRTRVALAKIETARMLAKKAIADAMSETEIVARQKVSWA